MGMVGSGTRSGFATNEMAMALASAVRLSARYGGFPYTVLMLLLLIAWLSVKTMWERPQAPDGRDTKVPPTFAVLPMLFGVALGFGLSAPAWLALLDLVQGSARELQSAAAHWQWRVPPAALPGLILPS